MHECVAHRYKVDPIATDEHCGYRLLGEGPDTRPHEVVTRSTGEYVLVSFTLRISGTSGAF